MWLHTENFAPNEPEGTRKSNLVTKKEFRLMLLGFGAIFLALIPIYYRARKDSYREICSQNMKAIAAAIDAYCNDQEGYYPLPFYVAADGAPQMEDGNVISWVSLVKPYMNSRKSFVCPAAEPDEIVKNFVGQGKVVESSYGVVAGVFVQVTDDGRMVTIRKDEVADPSNVAMLTETSNRGSQQSFDPLPFEDGQAKTQPWSGFLVGYEMDNLSPDVQDGKDVIRSNFVTRLAFRGTDKGSFEKAEGRHEFNYVVYAGGQRGKLLAKDAFVSRNRDNNPIAPWWPTNNRGFLRK